MKPILVILVLAVTMLKTYAQDQIFTNDNSKLLVKITEISPVEVKYKLFSNLNGPVYVLNKSEVVLILYENGRHETFTEYVPAKADLTLKTMKAPGMTRSDSSRYYKYSESISLNFLNFLNNEVGLIYQKDFIKNHFNIIIPVAIGVDKPSVTQAAYFNSSQHNIRLDRKLFEAGFGINYYPSFRFPINYYVGPSFRYIQYSCQQTLFYTNPNSPPYNYAFITKNGTLSRYCVSITNGLILRTQSRLLINIFASLGFKNDVASTKIMNPVTNQVVNPVTNTVNLYCWTGFAVGFSF